MSYVDRFLELPVISTISEESLPAFQNKSDSVVVGYIEVEDEKSQEQFQSLAEAMHPEFVFGISHSLELAKSEGVDVPGIAVYRAHDAEMATVSLSNSTDQMIDALRKAGRPLIIDLAFNTHNNFLDVSQKQRLCGRFPTDYCSRWASRSPTCLQIHPRDVLSFAKRSSHWHENIAKMCNSPLRTQLI